MILVASLGGIAAYAAILPALPGDFPAPVLLVQHRRPDAGLLATLLGKNAVMAVVGAEEGVCPQAGRVYVSPADRQIRLADDGSFALDRAGIARADPLLESCARVHGSRTLAVILTGRLDDGARGALAIGLAGGRVLAQDRASSRSFGMPSAAIATGHVDFVVPLERIALALVTLAMAPGGDAPGRGGAHLAAQPRSLTG